MVIASRRAFIGSLSAIGMAAASRAPIARASPRSAFRVALSVSPFTESVLVAAPLGDRASVARSVAEVQQLFV